MKKILAIVFFAYAYALRQNDSYIIELSIRQAKGSNQQNSTQPKKLARKKLKLLILSTVSWHVPSPSRCQ